ncbi:MAG: tail fiber domain-containing protein, partial [Patescibacteria group bacterium]|nr:tail fiber domain-containing protein [Patescibacteria group bacterium]
PYTFTSKNVSARGVINDSNFNLAGFNVTGSSGLFSWLGSLASRITKLFVGEIDVWAGDFNVSNAQNGSLFYVQNSSGNVGIGTVSPGAKLHINSGGSASSVLLLRGADDRNQNEYLLNVSDSDTNSRGSVIISTASGPSLVAIGGNVGFGTDDPAELLEIFGSSQTDGTDPIGIQIHDDTSSAGWTAGAEWASLNFYSDDISGAGPGIVAKISVVTEDTGHAENGFAFYTSGATLSEAMRIASDGNVGIGTASPGVFNGVTWMVAGSEGLHINSSTMGYLMIDGGTGGAIALNDPTQPINTRVAYIRNEDSTLSIQARADSGTLTHTLFAGNLSTGNVGIGTTSPGAKLEVKDGRILINSTADGLEIAETTAGNVWKILTRGTGELAIFEDSNRYVTIQNNTGNFGIGTVNPTHLLSVKGTTGALLNISGTLGEITTSTGARQLLLTGQPLGALFTQATLAINVVGIGDENRTLFGVGVAGSERFSIDEDGDVYVVGDVGIGTASPATKLEVAGGGTAGLKVTSTNTPVADIQSTNTAFGGTTLNVYSARNTAGGNSLLLVGSATNPSAFEVQSDGSVGIGTTTPGAELELVSAGTSTQTQVFISGYNDQELYTPELRFLKSHSDTKGTLTTTLTTELLGQIVFTGVDSEQNKDVGVIIKAVQDGAAGNFLPTNLIFNTYSSTGANTNQLVLHNDGFVGIGTASPIYTLDIVAGDDAGIRINADAAKKASLRFSQAGTTEWKLHNDGTDSDKFKFQEGGGAYIMTLESGGNVGIGTANPQALLNVAVTSGYATIQLNSAVASARSARISKNYDSPYDWKFFNSGNANPMPYYFYTDNETVGPKLTILGNGNVGIGTASPLAKLHVQTADVDEAIHANADEFVIEGTGTTGMTILSGTAEESTIFFGDADSAIIGQIKYDNNDDAIEFVTNLVQRMVIDSSGKVGIATATPNYELSVAGRIESARSAPMLILNETDTNHSWFLVADADTLDVRNATTASNPFFSIESSGDVGIGSPNPDASLEIRNDVIDTVVSILQFSNLATNSIGVKAGVLIDSRFTNNRNGSAIEFGQDDDYRTDAKADSNIKFLVSSANSLSEAMRIQFDGNVGIGTTSPGKALSVVGTINQSNAVSCGVTAGADGSLNCDSDEKLKDIFEFYSGGLEVIDEIKPIVFSFKEEDYVHVGFSAQNVQKVLPEATPIQESGYLGFDSNAVLALSVNAIKELREENNALKQELCSKDDTYSWC